jgi:hypothetical protein
MSWSCAGVVRIDKRRDSIPRSGETTIDCGLPGGSHARLHATFIGCQ